MDPNIADSEENKKRLRGELFTAFVPELVKARDRCSRACNRFNDTRDTTRRHRVELWRDITLNKDPMPPVLEDPDADAAQFDATDAWVEPPIHIDWGTEVKLAPGSFVNFNAVFVDSRVISIGARTIVGPNCSFYAGTHPLDPAVRRGLEGPEFGKGIVIEDDCWLAGSVTVLDGVRIGRGSTIGAGSVVSRDIPPFSLAVGCPARVIRKIESEWNKGAEQSTSES